MFSKVPEFHHKVDLPVSQCATAAKDQTYTFYSGKQVNLHPIGTSTYVDNVPHGSFKFSNGYPDCHEGAVIMEEIEFVMTRVII